MCWVWNVFFIILGMYLGILIYAKGQRRGNSATELDALGLPGKNWVALKRAV